MNHFPFLIFVKYNLQNIYQSGYYETRCFEIERFIVDYPRLIDTIQNYYNYIDFSENHSDENIGFDEYVNREYTCCICYDCDEVITGTNSETGLETFGLQNCKHSFHKNCIKQQKCIFFYELNTFYLLQNLIQNTS